jgi:hypothetical protein
MGKSECGVLWGQKNTHLLHMCTDSSDQLGLPIWCQGEAFENLPLLEINQLQLRPIGNLELF